MMPPVISAQGLTRHFCQARGQDIVAVDGLDLTVQRGEVFGFLGPNGAGKTTTVRLLNGLLAPTSGSASVLGYDAATQSQEIRRQSGVLTETPSLYETMDARQNLAFFGTLYDVPASELDRRVDRLLHEFGLSERAADKVGTYSKGMRQRLAIARALLHDPQVLFLDEPTSGLDPEAARMVRETIRQQGDQQRTIFMCTHNLTEAQHLCQRVAVMDRGALRAVGTPQELARALWSTVNVAIELLHEPQVELLSALTALPFVRACQAQYRELQLEIDHEDHIADLVLQLASAGARIYAVRPQEHTLEDIYFKIQESAPAPAPAAKGGGQPRPEGRA